MGRGGGLVVVGGAALVLVLGLASLRAAGVPQPAGTATGSAAGPVLVVTPSVGLVDGQQVQVSGSGFGAGSEVVLGECRQGATSVSDCSSSGAVVVADQAGSFATTFVVSTPIEIGAAEVDCTAPSTCELAAGVLPGLSSSAATPLAFAPAVPAPSPTTPSSTRYYLALGDSLATGDGAPAGQGYVDDLATHYRSAIPGLVTVDLGCPGETTVSFINGGKCPYPQGSQLAAAEAFLDQHHGQVALVTLDIGGDDITGCASSSPPFTVSADCVANALAQIATNLGTIGGGLRSAAGASVPIAGMTYFDPFVVEWLAGPAGEQEAVDSVQALDQLNTTLEDTYRAFGAVVADVAGAFSSTDLTDLVGSPYGTVPEAVAVACAWLTVVCRAGGPVTVSVHPNATGYAQIASAFEAVLGPLAANGPPPAPVSPPSSTVPAAGPTLAFTGFDALRWAAACVACVALGAGLLRVGRRRRRRRPAGALPAPGAGERARTSIPRGGPGPKPGASTSSATPASGRQGRV